MPYGIPQGRMFAMRGMGADGAGIRNRGMEQFSGGSGNPNMPMWNTSAMPRFNSQPQQPGVGSLPVQGGEQSFAGRLSPGAMGQGYSGTINQLMGGGGVMPSKPMRVPSPMPVIRGNPQQPGYGSMPTQQQGMPVPTGSPNVSGPQSMAAFQPRMRPNAMPMFNRFRY